MDWGKIGDFLIGNGLPLLGGAVGGPVGAGVGKVIASAIGAGSGEPEEVMGILTADPNAVLELKKVEAEHRHELRKITLEGEIANLGEINRTMREEIKSEDAFVRRARPGLVWAISGSVVLEVLAAVAVVFIAPEQIANLGTLYGAISIPQSIAAAVCGVYMKKRSDDKLVAAGGTTGPGLLSGVLGALRR
jgi:hypothetical protein